MQDTPVNGLTLLVVEDEAPIRRLVAMEFEDLGFTVLEAANIAEARLFFSDKEQQVDIALFDLRLPDGDGLTLLQEVKAAGHEGPILMMTGHGNKHTVLESFKAGAYDFLEKPFSMSGDLMPVVIRAAGEVRLRKENTSLTSQILHNTKLAALGELSATVLHDIRGPLSLIHVVCEDISETLEDGSPLDATQMKEHVGQILKACARIRKLGDHLRNFARQDAHESMETKSVESLLDDSLFLVQQKIRAGRIRVHKIFECSAKNASLHCYPNKFEQVIMNLISNACDAMSTSSCRDLTLKSSVTPDGFFLEVSDSGTGIPPDIQEKIFDTFFTTKPRGEGTGLGLKIVRNIVLEHGGDLTLQSTVGQGTTFTVRLPPSLVTSTASPAQAS